MMTQAMWSLPPLSPYSANTNVNKTEKNLLSSVLGTIASMIWYSSGDSAAGRQNNE
jgi:hypothetical protein